MIDNSTATLEPIFKGKVELFFKKIREAGINNAMIFEGRRSLDRQYQLFGQGRSSLLLKKY